MIAGKHYNLRYLNNNEMVTKCQMIINSYCEFMIHDVVSPFGMVTDSARHLLHYTQSHASFLACVQVHAV